MAEIELRNDSDEEFVDISSELIRSYLFPGGEVVVILHPQWLSVADSGGHRILDGRGFSHYIPSGWIHLEWTVKAGSPHFVK